uniref:Stonustoxin-like helical domain-containing protein n=1 Tax=Pundamilia nyererei TaxID=303518 RepID=A0A3B4HC53_9CICH
MVVVRPYFHVSSCVVVSARLSSKYFLSVRDSSVNPWASNDFEIVASESISGKSSALSIDPSLKASFLVGLVQVDGSAKYLNDSKSSRNQARVTLKYKKTTKIQELSMNHLGRGNVKHPYVFDQGLATHVVTAILYGAQAFFVFDREVSEQENHQDIQGSLKMIIKKIPKCAIEGEGSLKKYVTDKASLDKFSCRFYGDFCLPKPPTTFQDAVEVYQSLPGLLGDKAVPVKVWLLPLTCLDSSAAKLVRQISTGLVQEAQRVLEDFSELEMRYNDVLGTSTAQQFPQIDKKIKSFKEMCSEFKLEFQQTLAKKLPSIRGGGEEEAELAEILKKRHSSPFSSKNLNEWMDCKEREIYTLIRSTRREPTQTRGEHANSTQKDPGLTVELNSGPSCCAATVLTTVPPCWHPICSVISSSCSVLVPQGGSRVYSRRYQTVCGWSCFLSETKRQTTEQLQRIDDLCCEYTVGHHDEC